MDFELDEAQTALAGLAGRLIGDLATPERVAEVEASDEWIDRRLWDEMGRAGLLGVAVPEDHGGLGFGVVEVCLVLEQVGRTVAPGPILPTLLAGLVVGRHGSPALASAVLPDLARGATVAAVALHEAAMGSSGVRGRPSADGWSLTGQVDFVDSAGLADVLVVPAALEGVGERLVVVRRHPPTVDVSRSQVITGETVATVTLDGVTVGADEVLGEGSVTWLLPRATVAHCAVQAGVCEGALRTTSRYVSEREQFGAKIGTFQAVGQRAADAYIDTEAIRLTMLQAAWLLDHDDPDAGRAVAVAKFWAAEGAQRVVHTAQHLHGGIGVDTDYPVHRYFRWAKVHELALGGGTRHLLTLGHHLASD